MSLGLDIYILDRYYRSAEVFLSNFWGNKFAVLTFLLLSLVYLRYLSAINDDRSKKRTDSVGFINKFNRNIILKTCLGINFNIKPSPGEFKVIICDRSAIGLTLLLVSL